MSNPRSGPPPTTHKYGSFDPEMVGVFNEYSGNFAWDVVGESHYQAALEKACGGRSQSGHSKEIDALVVPETGNPYDPFAVAIHIDDGVVGYLSRSNARRYRLAIGNMGFAGVAFKVPAKIVGGWEYRIGERGHFGVKLDLPGQPAPIEEESERGSSDEKPDDHIGGAGLFLIIILALFGIIGFLASRS